MNSSKRKLNILVVSATAWNMETNDGNTLTNIFDGIEANYANIYFSEGLPSNKQCEFYLQYTDRMVLEYFLKFKEIGKVFSSVSENSQVKITLETFGKKNKKDILFVIRELAWKFVKLNNRKLKEFLGDFKPDVIFFPTYGYLRIQRLELLLNKICKAPIIGFISDDLYSYKSSQSVLKKIYQYFLRKNLRKSFKSYSLVYTMTKEQQIQIKHDFNIDSKILYKNIYQLNNLHKMNNPIRFIYAGGLYFGRDEVLAKLGSILDEFNCQNENLKAMLSVYSFDDSDSFEGIASIRKFSGIKYEQLLKEYSSSDITVLVESFDKCNEELTRLSFSTKILDGLQSGTALLAIGPSSNAGFNYLKANNAAVVINNINKIDKGINEIIINYDEYVNLARNCVLQNHDKKKNTDAFINDLYSIIKL